MGKKNKNSSSLGRALIRNQQQTNRGRRHTSDNSLLHTTEIPDGYDWGRLNLQSVTEESSFQEFLSTAELAGTEYENEKLNITFVNPATNVGLLTEDETKKIKQEHENNKGLLTIPRRPPWTSNMSVSELEANEKHHFLEWRRTLAVLQEEKGLLMTPYEKNLEFWRQLWRVVERSDVIVQIVDARNPLLFRCEDLEKYVKEVSSEKLNFILLNKADFLTKDQRRAWYNYFKSLGVQIAFFSAIAKTSTDTKTQADDTPNESEKQTIKSNLKHLEVAVDDISNNLQNVQKQIERVLETLSIDKNNLELDNCKTEDVDDNQIKIQTREELIQLFKTIHNGKKVTSAITTIGLVGYPNVGKSSTINTLMTEKKVSVSATPGKTKHFQTLYLDTDLLLCDCPGLVMPSFVFTKAEMIINGILPIDQMRDHVPPINLVCRLIPRHILEDNYGIMIPKPSEEEENPNRPPTSEELLNAYGYMRGFMTANGQPDNPRSARYILKDFVNGKLLYCTAPPGIRQDEYHQFPERKTKVRNENMIPPREVRVNKPLKETAADVDSKFFKTTGHGIHTKGSRCISSGLSNSSDQQNTEKPWKKLNKHSNKNKREKLRRVYAHLDQH